MNNDYVSMPNDPAGGKSVSVGKIVLFVFLGLFLFAMIPVILIAVFAFTVVKPAIENDLANFKYKDYPDESYAIEDQYAVDFESIYEAYRNDSTITMYSCTNINNYIQNQTARDLDLCSSKGMAVAVNDDDGDVIDLAFMNEKDVVCFTLSNDFNRYHIIRLYRYNGDDFNDEVKTLQIYDAVKSNDSDENAGRDNGDETQKGVQPTDGAPATFQNTI